MKIEKNPSNAPSDLFGTPYCPKSVLSRQLVENSLGGQKSSVKDYILVILGICVAALLGTFVFWLFYLFIVNGLLALWKMIKTNRNRKNLEHYVLERPCNEKEIVVSDEDPDVYKLWFSNKDGSLNVSIHVDQKDYEATELNDLFFLVFVPNEVAPCLWYRASEWELDKRSWD